MNTPEDGMDAHVRRIGETLSEVFVRADAEGVPTSVIADRLAEERFKK
jgi:leucine dehydrogenase